VFEVRQLISDELAALNAVPRVDITGLALTLGSLMDRVDALPLQRVQRDKPASPAQDGEGTTAPPQDWRGRIVALLHGMWEQFKTLVVIRRSDQPVKPLLSEEAQQYLYQNLRLTLAAARVALLNRDARSFRDDLARARRWIEAYFQPEAAETSAMLASLQELSRAEITPELPDISASLARLRRLIETRARGATAAESGAAPAVAPGAAP
jgi:uroporphyrin-3 C-methyltransferase